MKIIKLDRRYKLFDRGFTYAFHGSYASDPKIGAVVRYFERVYGNNRLDGKGNWCANFGKGKMRVYLDHGGSYTTQPYLVAVRREADVTAAVLATGGL